MRHIPNTTSKMEGLSYVILKLLEKILEKDLGPT